MYIEQIDYI